MSSILGYITVKYFSNTGFLDNKNLLQSEAICCNNDPFKTTYI